MPALFIAPVNPAASANGTVNPSDMPITISRTVSPAVKWRSMCRVCGMLCGVRWPHRASLWIPGLDGQAGLNGQAGHGGLEGQSTQSIVSTMSTQSSCPTCSHKSEFPDQHQYTDHDERCARGPFNPFERHIFAYYCTHKNPNRRDRSQRQRGGQKDLPRPFLLGGHGHRCDLSLVAHFGQKYDTERRQEYAPIHLHLAPRSALLSFARGVVVPTLAGQFSPHGKGPTKVGTSPTVLTFDSTSA